MPGSERSRGRLIPYVEIITGKGIKRPIDIAIPPSPPSLRASEFSPRKKGKMRDRGDSIVASSVQEIPSRPVSPAVSEVGPISSRTLTRTTSPSTGQMAVNGNASSSRVSRAQSPNSAPSSGRNLEPYIYQTADNELEELSDLEVPGEVLASESDSDEYDSDDEAVPVRVLDDFTVYNASTKSIVHASMLALCQRTDFVASGIVRHWLEDAQEGEDDIEENDDEDPVILRSTLPRVQLTKILDFNTHDFRRPPRGPKLDGKIYIRTKHAWYILGYPSNRYSPFFTPFWISHRITHLLLSEILRNYKLELEDFCERLPTLDADNDEVATARDILGRELDEQDVNDGAVQAYLIDAVEELHNELSINRAPIVRKILSDSSAPKLPPLPSKTRSKRKGSSNEKHTITTSKDLNRKNNQGTTFNTPLVSRISQDLFEVNMDVAQEPEKEASPIHNNTVNFQAHKYDTDKIRWGKEIPGQARHYLEVCVEDTIYKINDVVMVVPDASYTGKNDFGRTTNEYGRSMWFCQIRYFFETSGRKMFHGQWFLHGSKTILHELSHPQALYPVNMCDDNLVNCIYTKCNIRFLKQGELESLDDVEARTNDFHCGLFYHHEFAELVDFPPSFVASLSDSTGTCSSCEFEAEEELRRTPTIAGDDLVYGGVHYHPDDFVYLRPPEDGKSKLLRIGQIVEIWEKSESEPMISVRFHIRHSDLEKKLRREPFCHPENEGLFIDERRLILSPGDAESESIIPEFLSGHCYVRHLTEPSDIQKWTHHDDHFFVKDILLKEPKDGRRTRRLKKGDFDNCSVCLGERQAKIEDQKLYMKTSDKLVGMELFCGAGGLGSGMELSGFVETRYAVDAWAPAALTFKTNHPRATVCCQDTNNLLRYVVSRDNGENPSPLRENDGKHQCPEMPKKGDQVDFIFGGPPCQAFSRMNHSRDKKDIRSTMPCNMLSYVEYYQPKYFLLENVAGLLDHKLTDKRGFYGHGGSDEIKFGMVKFILRTLVSLGYQVRYKLLQAIQYGVPQSRTRLIFFGAKRGLTLPEFPVPVYAFTNGVARASVPTGEQGKPVKIPPPSRWRSKKAGKGYESLFHQFAPFEMVSIHGAIGDLPAFDWKNPGIICKPRSVGKGKGRGTDHVQGAEERGLSWFGHPIPELEAQWKMSKQPVGFFNAVEYATEPQNRYQKWLRRNESNAVKDHYTDSFGAEVVEATVNVPLKPDSFHIHLPMVLWPNYAKPGKRQANKVFYGRVDGYKYFKCAMTQMKPNLKNTWPLHPLQKRIFTVRELARAQGFSDDYQFCSTADIHTKPKAFVEDQIKQIGNAVAVPFALALGKELGEACIADWKEAQKQGQGEREGSAEV